MKSGTKTIAIDFDQTIAMYDPKYWATKYVVKVPVRAKPNYRVVRLMNALKKDGHKVIIYTSRWWGDYETVKNFLEKYDIPFDDIILGRFKADCYICDKSINPRWPDVADRCFDILEEAK